MALAKIRIENIVSSSHLRKNIAEYLARVQKDVPVMIFRGGYSNGQERPNIVLITEEEFKEYMMTKRHYNLKSRFKNKKDEPETGEDDDTRV